MIKNKPFIVKLAVFFAAVIGLLLLWILAELASLRISAGQGGDRAQYELAQKYVDYGLHAWSAVWYEKAAEQGHTAAQYRLGMFYLRGDSGKISAENREKGCAWLLKAASQGNKWAQWWRGGYCYTIDEYEQAKQWFEKAHSGSGYHIISYSRPPQPLQILWRVQSEEESIWTIRLADLYHDGAEGFPPDPEEAARLYKDYSGRAYPYQCERRVRLGNMYRDGFGVEQDIEKAESYYRSAATADIIVGVLAYTEEKEVLQTESDRHRPQTKEEIEAWCQNQRDIAEWGCKAVYYKPHMSIFRPALFLVGLIYLCCAGYGYVCRFRKKQTPSAKAAGMVLATGIFLLLSPAFPSFVTADAAISGYCIRSFLELAAERMLLAFFGFVPCIWLWYKIRRKDISDAMAQYFQLWGCIVLTCFSLMLGLTMIFAKTTGVGL